MSRSALGLVALALAACGEGDHQPASPPLPFNKVAPTLPRLVRQRSLEQWLEQAASPVPLRRAEAVLALGELLTQAADLAPLLERLLADPDPDVRYGAVVVAGRLPGDLGAEVSRRVASMLGAAPAGLGAAVEATLRALGPRAVPALERLAGEGEPGPRAAAAALLAEIRGAAPSPR